MATLRNVFACLVHDRRECIVDLLRNLRCQDADSAILLYNGGTDPWLLDKHTLARRYGAIVHPQSRPLAWGRLHDFAFDCMRLALETMPFDTLTIVDSDQLLLRANYPEYLARFLAGQRDIGMLGSTCAAWPADSTHAPVRSAFREIDLWRPLLQRFPDGTQKFACWTYWPATVFTADAARSLIQLRDTDAQVEDILHRTRICATEEIILPTLCALLGYRIAVSPCSYDYIRWRETFTRPQIDAAVSRRDVFWIHPIPRSYRDATRSYVREIHAYYNHIPAGRMA